MIGDNMMRMNFDCLGWYQSPDSVGERQEWTWSKHLYLSKLYEKKSNINKTEKETLMITKELEIFRT